MAGVVVAAGEPSPEPKQEASSMEAVPPWWRQVTARSVALSVVLGTLFCFMAMRVGLTVGIVPSFNMSASLVSFFAISSWTRLMARCGVACQPFTRQENVVVQTCIISCATLSLYGGFTTYLPAMTATVAKSTGGAGTGQGVSELHPAKIMAFLFLVSFASLFCTFPLRKIMILDYKLLYPSGSAIAGIVNSFHTSKGAKTARLQMRALSKCVAGSFTWACFQWFYTAGDGCGFQSFPLFGLEAYSKRLYFDFSPGLVGVGMICPQLINFSILFGAVTTSWIIWPIIQSKKGEWYTDASPVNFKGINGYKVSMGVALVLGDCLFQLGVISTKAADYYNERREKKPVPKSAPDGGGNPDEHSPRSYDEHRRNQIFLNDGLPANFAYLSYIVLAIISTIFVPRIFPQIKYYHVAFGYTIAPLLAFCNSYASGLTDWSLGTVYGKLAIFIVGAWVGEASGGAIAGLVACGVMLVIIGNAAELMQDFKSGYLTLTSPLSMFISQAIGTALGCLINPLVFMSFQKLVGKEHLGEAGSAYAAPMAAAYRAMAVVSVEGVETLPKHCIQLCGVCFLIGLCLDCLTAVAKSKNWKVNGYIPNPMAMSIPFFLGPTLSIDLCMGSLILIIWRRVDKTGAAMFGLVSASGLICGDGLWAFPSAILSILKVEPPICMKYLSSYQSERVDQHFLPNLDTSTW